MTDPRAGSSPMPAAAAAIGQAVVDQLKPLLNDAFVRIDALPGAAAERENDALSALAHVGSFVALQLTARLMQRKRVDPETAIAIAMRNISDRTVAEFVGVLFGRTA